MTAVRFDVDYPTSSGTFQERVNRNGKSGGETIEAGSGGMLTGGMSGQPLTEDVVPSAPRRSRPLRETTVRSSMERTYHPSEECMPEIEQRLLDSVIYLYPTQEDARAGGVSGGSGFLLSVDLPDHPGMIALYAVTNAHVIGGGATVIRLNAGDADVKTIPYQDAHWQRHPNGDDVAAAFLGVFPSQPGQIAIPEHMILERDAYRRPAVGDEVFFLGRFVGLDGILRNSPMARFGNIAMASPQRIQSEGGLQLVGFLVDSRSASGFSGSPVFTTRRWEETHVGRNYQRLLDRYQGELDRHQLASRYSSNAAMPKPPRAPTWRPDEVRLIGMTFGHILSYEPVLNAQRQPMSEGLQVRHNSGVMGVVPAWTIMELVMDERLVERREARAHQMSPSGAAIATLDANLTGNVANVIAASATEALHTDAAPGSPIDSGPDESRNSRGVPTYAGCS